MSTTNLGCHVVNRPDVVQPERTIVVLGLPRGGTSFIASTLANLGVPFEPPSPFYDSAEVLGAVLTQDWSALSQYADTMNRRYPIWGTKVLGPPKNVAEAIPLLRNPMLIFVFRDPPAVATRKQMVGKATYQDAWKGVTRVQSAYRRLTQAVSPLDYPTLMVSYGNTMQNVPAFVQLVNDFIGAPVLRSLSQDDALQIAAYVLGHGNRYRRSVTRKAARAELAEKQARAEARRADRKTRQNAEKRLAKTEERRRLRKESRRSKNATPPAIEAPSRRAQAT